MRTLSPILAAMSIACGFVQSSQAGVFNAATDFSTSSNPNGVWSYGGATTLDGDFSPFTSKGVVSGVGYWANTTGLAAPIVFHNGTQQSISLASWVLPAGQLAFHPGASGTYTFVRFVAPESGVYSLDAVFTGIDTRGTTTDVHVLLNHAGLFAGSINGYGSSAAYSSVLALAAGTVLDFAVGFGANGTYNNDSTAISVRINSVPVPEQRSILMLGMSVGLGLGIAGPMKSLRGRRAAS